jgi:hypothetical protein
LRRGLGFRAACRRARAILEISDMRNQRRLAEESAECTDTTIQLQVGECVRNVRGMTESHNSAGHRMPNFIDAGTDRRFDVFAALRVGKSLPIAPSLNHEKSSNL